MCERVRDDTSTVVFFPRSSSPRGSRRTPRESRSAALTFVGEYERDPLRRWTGSMHHVQCLGESVEIIDSHVISQHITVPVDSYTL